MNGTAHQMSPLHSGHKHGRLQYAPVLPGLTNALTRCQASKDQAWTTHKELEVLSPLCDNEHFSVKSWLPSNIVIMFNLVFCQFRTEIQKNRNHNKVTLCCAVLFSYRHRDKPKKKSGEVFSLELNSESIPAHTSEDPSWWGRVLR